MEFPEGELRNCPFSAIHQIQIRSFEELYQLQDIHFELLKDFTFMWNHLHDDQVFHAMIMRCVNRICRHQNIHSGFPFWEFITRVRLQPGGPLHVQHQISSEDREIAIRMILDFDPDIPRLINRVRDEFISRAMAELEPQKGRLQEDDDCN